MKEGERTEMETEREKKRERERERPTVVFRLMSLARTAPPLRPASCCLSLLVIVACLIIGILGEDVEVNASAENELHVLPYANGEGAGLTASGTF